MTEGLITPAHVLAHVDPNWFEELTPTEQVAVFFEAEMWIRPEQRIPTHHWDECGLVPGRGFGKTWRIAVEVNRRVLLGQERLVGLLAPTDKRVKAVQHAALQATAPPWLRPEVKGEDLYWPNGVKAQYYTPQNPGRSRGDNLSLTWMTEIVDWLPKNAIDTYDTVTTATRVGAAQTFWDSTSTGAHPLLDKLYKQAKDDPVHHVLIQGTTFDNPLLSDQYLRREYRKYTGRRLREELYGEHFPEEGGALWKQSWLDSSRVAQAPGAGWQIIAVDPAQSTHSTSDETGIMIGQCAREGRQLHAYLTADRSGIYEPQQWGDIVVQYCTQPGRQLGGRVVIERNHLGDNAAYVISSRARVWAQRNRTTLITKIIPKDAPWPPQQPGVVHIREVVSRDSKADRATAPAAETEAGNVHLVGYLSDLETQLTTWVPGVGRSPNRLDAAVFAITELLDLREVQPDVPEQTRVAAEGNKQLTALTGARARSLGI